MHLVRERSRSAYTLGLVMVVLAMMLALAATSGSVGRSVTTWVDKRFGADLLAYNGSIPPAAESTVASVPAVRAVTSITFGQVRMTAPHDGSYNLVLIDPAKFFTIAGFPWADGNDDAVKQALSSGGAALLPANVAQQLHVRRGGRVTLRTRDGPAPFEVAGVYAAFGAGNEVGIVASLGDAGRFFVSDRRNVLYINLDPRTPRRTAIEAVDAALVRTRPTGSQFVQDGPDGSKVRSGYFFTTGAQNKAEARRNVRSYFTLFYAVLFVAVIVGLLGLANTMATSVIHRYRELGILGAVGAGPDDIRRMVLAEAAVLVGTAFVLSLALGTLLARLLVDGVTALVGFHIDFVFPWMWVPTLGVLAAVIAFTAALAPARRAARLTPVEALRYE
jgi:putative ABC transport system permease protein